VPPLSLNENPPVVKPAGPLSHVTSMAKAIRDTMEPRNPRPKVTGEPVMVRIQPDMAKQLDDWRRKQDDLPGRPEAIRRLIELGLKAKK
jgi:hypothetical protein